MKKWLVMSVALLIVALSFGSAAYALSMFTKTVVGLGSVQVTGQVSVADIAITSPTDIQVRLASNSQTPTGGNYAAHLYLDGVEVAQQLVSWTPGQSPGTVKKLTFTGLDLGSVTNYGVEVRPTGLAAPAPTPIPPPTSNPSGVSYAATVQPIFNQYCTGCHGSAGTAGVRLNSYDNTMGSGVVVAGNANASRLHKVLVGSGAPQMPPGGGQIPLASIQAVDDWISQGALNN